MKAVDRIVVVVVAASAVSERLSLEWRPERRNDDPARGDRGCAMHAACVRRVKEKKNT